MTKTQTPTPDELRTQAEALSRQAAEAQAAVDELTIKEWEAEQAEQAKRDQETVDTYRRAELDQAIEEASAAFDQALADLPVTQALAAYIAAGYRRAWAHSDFSAARSRLGLSDAGAPPHPAFVPPFEEAIKNAATRMAQATIDTERTHR